MYLKTFRRELVREKNTTEQQIENNSYQFKSVLHFIPDSVN